MEVPKDHKVIEWPTSYMWFDDDGVLYSKPKPGPFPVPTKEEQQKQLEDFKQITGGKKVCMILESDPNSKPPNKAERDWIARELNEITKAMAIISTSPLSRMIANLFFGLKPPAYPVKMVSDEKEGKEWIKQYL